MTLFLGIDAGGSHCRARLTDAAGAILGVGEAGPANTRVGMELLFERLMDAANQACQEAGLSPADIKQLHAGMGIAGINRAGAKAAVQALPFPFARLAITGDSHIAILGAHMGGDGAVLILGTGSVGIVKRGEDTFSLGGYGFPISDEGSGAALGLSAIRHALRTLDGRTKPTPLSDAVAERFDRSIPQVIAWMDEATPRDYAALAPLVLDHAERGDDIALSIVREAAAHVERFIETMYRRGARECAMMGGLAERMKPWLRAYIVNRLVDPLGDALDGALLLAGRAPSKAR
jgi:glucosamine kinase